MRRKFISLILVLLQVAVFAGAQKIEEKPVDATPPKISDPLPFRGGETLTYEVSFSKLIFSGTIGEITMTVSNKDEPQEPSFIELKAEAVSKGFFPKLFGMKVNDHIISLVSPADFGLHTSVTRIEEGARRREKKSIINRQVGRVTFIERDLANETAKPKIKEGASPGWVLDVLSAIYFLRTQELKAGDVIPVPVSDEGKTYNIEVVVDKSEEVKVEGRKFEATRLDVKAFDGRFVRRSGEMSIWVSEDSLRLPVRARIKSSGATVTIKLKDFKFS